MEHLRWIILAVGLVVVFVIYLIGRRNDKSRQLDVHEPLSVEDIPSVRTDADDIYAEKIKFDDAFVASEINHFEIHDELVDTVTLMVDDIMPDIMAFGAEDVLPYSEHNEEAQQAIERPAPKSELADDVDAVAPQDDLIVIHVQAKSSYFSGNDLLRVINYQQLKFGDMNIYHAYADEQVIFSMSNMLQPGHFDPEHITDMRTPGVILFTQLALLDDPLSACERILHCAKTFARELDGTLNSSDQKPLTDEKVQLFKDKASYFSATVRPA
ncbi:MAG: hypothetical protein OEY36_08725 [Gammaproteobacteria bacterium]|nr:hypothetical protein [Gammaproteobacteria bacterium]